MTDADIKNIAMKIEVKTNIQLPLFLYDNFPTKSYLNSLKEYKASKYLPKFSNRQYLTNDIKMLIKKLLILIILLQSIALAGQPYFNETSQWKQYRRESFYPNSVIVDDNIIRFDGDTLIGSTLYYKVLETGTHFAYYTPQGDTVLYYNVHKYLHPIREENQFVYAYNPSTGKEYLLYDFSVGIGDTLQTSQTGDCLNNPIINIDTVYLGDKPRRRFHCQHLPIPDILIQIEGIGSTRGLFEPVCFFSQSQLQCYSQDGDFIQFPSLLAPDFDCSSLILADERIEENKFRISPNPFLDEFQIHFLGELSQTATISIVNLMGSVMFEIEIQSPQPFEDMDVSYLPAGIYIIYVRDKGKFGAQKIIKL